MFLRKNSFFALFCIGSPLPKEEYFSSYSDWISQRKSEYFWSCSDWMQREIVRASSVLLPHLYNPPPLYTHIIHASFFKPKTKPWWTIYYYNRATSLLGGSAVIRIIFANPAGRPKGFWRMELDQEDIRVHTNKNSHRVKIPREWGNVLTAAKIENCWKCFIRILRFVFVSISVFCIFVEIHNDQKENTLHGKAL